MAGHSKWANIKHKKAASDSKKQKIFQKINKEMISAIRQGGADESSNAALRLVIEKAKSANMPKDNIKRTLERAGKEKDSSALQDLTYEGYGPGGVAIVVECLSDNVNRTSASVKSYFSKRGGNLGSTGSVSYMFETKGQFVFEADKTEDEIFELIMEGEIEIENLELKNDIFIIDTKPNDYMKTKELLSKNGIEEFLESGITKLSATTVKLTESQFEKYEKMIEMMEDDDDVINVYSNVE